MSDTAFHFSDGSRAATVKELAKILRHAHNNVTARHVTPERNDYAQWVLHVHNDPVLSEQIRGCHTPQEVAGVIEKQLAQNESAQLTPLKDKLRAIAPKPSLATSKTPKKESSLTQKASEQDIPVTTPEHQPAPHKAATPQPTHTAEQSSPPKWTPSTPIPKHDVVSVKSNPHVRDFVLGLVIGIVIGVLAYGLLLQVI